MTSMHTSGYNGVTNTGKYDCTSPNRGIWFASKCCNGDQPIYGGTTDQTDSDQSGWVCKSGIADYSRTISILGSEAECKAEGKFGYVYYAGGRRCYVYSENAIPSTWTTIANDDWKSCRPPTVWECKSGIADYSRAIDILGSEEECKARGQYGYVYAAGPRRCYVYSENAIPSTWTTIANGDWKSCRPTVASVEEAVGGHTSNWCAKRCCDGGTVVTSSSGPYGCDCSGCGNGQRQCSCSSFEAEVGAGDMMDMAEWCPMMTQMHTTGYNGVTNTGKYDCTSSNRGAWFASKCCIGDQPKYG